ncbi:MAG: hypothetical protein ABIT83_16715 [Massilia sp.]
MQAKINHRTSTTTALLLFIATIVSVSPLIHAFSPIKGNVIYVVAVLVLLIRKSWWSVAYGKYLFWCLLVEFFALIPTLYWQQPLMFLIPTYLLVSILAVSVLDSEDVKAFVDLVSGFLVLTLAGAVIGTLYAYFGGASLLEFLNADGRANNLFLTTLTNSQFLNYIRPSGVFDEPGALSFVTCFVAALRHAAGCNKRVTWLMLGIGFITTSVAHLLYTVMHAAQEFKGNKRAGKFLLTAGLIALVLWLLVLFFPPIQDIFSVLFLSRLSGDDLGDDRATTMENALQYLDMRSIFFGLDPQCAVGIANCVIDKGYANYGDNPLTLLLHWGIFLAFPYYLSLTYFAGFALLRRNFIIVGLTILLLQRPYTMSYGYSLFILLTSLTVLNISFRPSQKAPGSNTSRPLPVSLIKDA